MRMKSRHVHQTMAKVTALAILGVLLLAAPAAAQQEHLLPGSETSDSKSPSFSVGAPGQAGMTADSVLERIRRHKFHPLENGFTVDAKRKRHGIADLADNDWRVRTLAIRDLARLGASAVSPLLAGLDDEDLHVRHVATLLLGIMPVEEPFAESLAVRRRALEKRLTEDKEPLVRSEAALGLGRIGDDESMNVLKQAAEDDSSRDVRHQCTLATDRIGKTRRDDSQFEAYRTLDESTFNTVAVGQEAKDFTLQDSDGLPWRISDVRGKKAVVLIWIFADWCPVCHGEFRDLVEMKEAFRESDVEVVTIQCHDLYRSRVMVGKELLPKYWFAKESPQAGYADAAWWSHLADPAGVVASMYGVSPLAFAVHSEYINRPSTIIIDKQGIVRFAYYGTFWGDRPSIAETLKMIHDGEFEFEHPRRLHAAQ